MSRLAVFTVSLRAVDPQRGAFGALSIGFALLACAHAPAQRPGLGLSKADAVEVCLPLGEQDYLIALRCPGGSPVEARRLGSVGTRTMPSSPDDPRILEQMDPGRPLARGEPDLHIVDAFEVRCPGRTFTLFVDVYHCIPRPQPAAPQGLSLQR